MTLRTYLEALNNLIKDNEDYLDLELIYSTGNEGNDFSPVYFKPSIVQFSSDERLIIELGKENTVICIN